MPLNYQHITTCYHVCLLVPAPQALECALQRVLQAVSSTTHMGPFYALLNQESVLSEFVNAATDLLEAIQRMDARALKVGVRLAVGQQYLHEGACVRRKGWMQGHLRWVHWYVHQLKDKLSFEQVGERCVAGADRTLKIAPGAQDARNGWQNMAGQGWAAVHV